MRILLVDDEIELTDPLSRVLTREGYVWMWLTMGQLGARWQYKAVITY
jgi:OmpR-family two-component system manganese-sensing response regulator